MNEETIPYKADSVNCLGKVFYDPKNKKSPLVIVTHDWRGQNEFARGKAKQIAELGYTGFAVDLYGDGKVAKSNEEAAALMQPLFMDRKSLRNRMVAAYEAIKNHPTVDPNNIGAIGFCFGGLCTIELYRSGVNLRGITTFHSIFGSKLGDKVAKLEEVKNPPKGAFLGLHGYKDPLVSQEDLQNFQKELSSYGVDWQMVIYGNATHAFTNPMVNDSSAGLVYHEQTARRAWEAMRQFFQEVFKR